MKRLLLAAVALCCASASAQTINPNQIRPSTTNGQVLTTTGGVTAWSTAGGAVSSVFGRTGAIVAAANDYSFSQISGQMNFATQGSGLVAVAHGGTGTATPGLVQGANVTITGSWPNQTINSTGGFTLTTTGSSGPATFSSGILNIPQYAGGGSMTYPGAGVAVSTGSAWGSSLTAPTGALVGTTDTQTLTNKTIDGVTPTTMGYVDPTSSVQTQLNAKAPTASPTFTGTVTTPVLVATGGAPGIVTPTLQLTDVTMPGCATFDASGIISSTGTACANVAGVTSLNTLTGAMVLTGGSNIALTTVGNNITINGLINAPVQTEYTPGTGRELSTVYQNLTTRMKIITVFFLNSNTTNFGTAFGYTDATTSPVQYAGGCTAPAATGGLNTPCSFTMTVPPNNYYQVKIFGGFGAYSTWYEAQP